MLFNSYEFIFLFLPISIIVYFWLNKKRLTQAGKAWLVFVSLFFYSWWDISYLPLILGSILFNFTIGTTISRNVHKTKKSLSQLGLLTFGIIANLSLLGYFKYTDFFISNVNFLLNTNYNLLHIILPLGISFFTFTQIAYLVDSYKKEVQEIDYLNYTLFVTFFPHLLAGPILHHKEMMPQFDMTQKKIINYKNLSLGLFLFAIGLFKKVVIADTFALWANAGFGTNRILTFFEAWATSLSYTFQLYFDFSGYTDMALGIALMFNIILPLNFNSPYKALNIQDFWRRWHMTLSRFLRDYIYIPLGGNKRSEIKTYANLFTVFLVGGLWHGASWMFVIWGALHGIAIVIHRIWQHFGQKMHTWLAWFITFNFVNITWVFFRAETWDKALNILQGMVGLQGIMLDRGLAKSLAFMTKYGVLFGSFLDDNNVGSGSLKAALVAIIFTVWAKNSQEWLPRFRPNYKYFLFTIVVMLWSITQLNHVKSFLYFNF